MSFLQHGAKPGAKTATIGGLRDEELRQSRYHIDAKGVLAVMMHLRSKSVVGKPVRIPRPETLDSKQRKPRFPLLCPLSIICIKASERIVRSESEKRSVRYNKYQKERNDNELMNPRWRQKQESLDSSCHTQLSW